MLPPAEQLFGLVEEGGQVLQAADDAGTVHQHEEGVVGSAEAVAEEVGLRGLPHSPPAHGFHRERGDVDGFHFLACRLQGQAVATASGSHVEDAAGGQLQGGPFQWRHLLLGAEQGADGYLILVELGGEHTQLVGFPVLQVVEDGGPHGVFVGCQQVGLYHFLCRLARLRRISAFILAAPELWRPVM